MGKNKGDAEPNWAEADKRIRNRRWLWTTQEVEKLEQGLMKLPDLSAEAQLIELDQPAIGPKPTEPEADATGHDGAGAGVDDDTN
jgi:hypothetical protein